MAARRTRTGKVTRRRTTTRRKPVARRKVSRNPRPRRRRVTAVNPRPRRRAYRSRSNPAELMELAALGNPAALSAAQRRKLVKLYRKYPGYQVAAMTGRSMGTISKYVRKAGYKMKKGRRPKNFKLSGKSRKSKSKSKSYKRARRVISLRVPKSAKKLRMEFNPAFSWQQLKDSAKTGGIAIAGFAGASFLTNLIAGKAEGSGTNLSVGPVKGSSVVAIIIAGLAPFIPIHSKYKEFILSGIWINAFSRLLLDVVPAESGLRKYIPTSLGDFGGLALPPTYEFGAPAMQPYLRNRGVGMYTDNPVQVPYQDTFDIGTQVTGAGLSYYRDNGMGLYDEMSPYA